MPDYDLVKERIKSSVFEKRAGEHYVAHLKIWEIENGNDKPRFIILAGNYFLRYCCEILNVLYKPRMMGEAFYISLD